MRRPHFTLPRATRSGWIQFVSVLLCYALLSPCFAALSSGMRASATSKKKITFEQFEQQGALDELLVKFREGASEEAKDRVALLHGSRRGKKLRGESALEKMDVPVGQLAEAFARLLASDPAVEFAEPNFLIKHDQFQTEKSESISAVTAPWLQKTSASVFPTRFDGQQGGTGATNGGPPSAANAGKFSTSYPGPQSGLDANDPRFNEQWALRNTGQTGGQFGSDINITTAWQTTTGSQATVIAVIDSGIDFTHPDLSNNQWTNPAPAAEGDLHGWDYIIDTGTIKDEQGHGTAIAGIIAAQGNNATGISGVMWRASLMSLRVLDNTGTGDIAKAVEAIDYAVIHGAQVINLSWGTTGESQALKDAIERAIRRGVVVVCSAGNSSQNVDSAPYYPASFGSQDLVTVAGTDNFDQLASWSNWGRRNVSVAAPGANILTTRMGGGYWSVNGTSAAAPFVAGVAGLIKSLRPQLNTHNVVKAITDQARQVASLSNKVAAGGVVNAAAALDDIHGSSNPVPPLRPQTPGYGSGGSGPGGTFSTTPPPRTTSGPDLNLPNLDQIRRAPTTQPRTQVPIQSNNVCADCDPYNGGGGGSYYPSGDPNFGTARERPANETGQPGVDLGSRNFNWSLPLVTLGGRAGLDLNLSLYYNSLVWTKDGNFIKYNADLGSPAPGFRVGLPTLQQRFYNSQTGIYAYMMVTPSGGRIELRQLGSSNIYEAQDGSYTQLDVSNANAPLVRTSDGTQLSFIPAGINSEYRCAQIKDRNGNYISATYDPNNGHLLTITDTLGRVITFVHDANGNLAAIRQMWGATAHDWATFSFGSIYVAPNFGGGLLVNGPNNNNVTVLTRVDLHDGSSFRFDYNAAFGQVNRINHHAADGHLLSYVSYNLDASAGQTDCPRFTERRDWAEYGVMNQSAEVLTTYSVAGDGSWSQQTTPDGTISKEFFATSGWQTGLTTSSEIWFEGVKKKWTTISWTQDDENLLYQKNPRVTETNVYDPEGNRKRVAISYYPVSSFSLPSDVYEYAADGVTLLRRSHTDYNLNQIYTDRRIIGLVFGQYVYDGAGALQSKQLYHRDWGSEWLVERAGAVQHDDANYGVGFVNGRANLVMVERYDVQYPDDQTRVLSVKTGYNTTGSVIFSGDGRWHRTDISYTDAFSDGINRNTFAFPTTITDPDGNSSTAQYNYDFGAVTRTEDPKGAFVTMAYDSAARISQVTNGINNAHTRWVYPAGMGYVQRFTTVQAGADEAYSVDFFDGWGKVRASAGDHPGSTGLYSAMRVMYDNMGRAVQHSNPAEVNTGWATVGDDAAGWVWTYQTYDWKGRALLTTNPDGTTTEASYGGCGCAGGEVTTVRDERGRRRRATMDVLGRLKQVEELNWDTTVYATTVYTYNARDQITQMNQAGQIRSLAYDGHGRLQSRTTPEQGTVTYSYFADDTTQTVTDARGATTTFAYNNRHLPTSITYGVPSGVAATPNVSFGYDERGNRTSMTDGLGSVSYVYNTLSQLTSETRSFSGVGSYTLSYAYNLAGELTSMTNQSGAQVGYNYDSVGRPTSVSGSGYGGVTSYVNSIAYRAFGMKQMNYANGKTLSLSYDNRMRVTQWNVPGVMGWNYSYNNFNEATGRVTYAQNLNDATLDRSYDYDNVGRLIEAHTGSEARGHLIGQGGAQDGPYSHSYRYDQLGNPWYRVGWGGSHGAWLEEWPTYTSNRRNGLQYDAAGNLTNDGYQSYTYDATGQQTYASATALAQSYDGDRLRAKKVEGASGNTPVFTNDPLVAGVTEVKAVHLTELRAAVNQARARAGLAAATWTDANVQANVTLIKAAHIQELRLRLDEARTALGLPAASYTDPTLTVGVTTVKAAHMQELRERVKEAQAAAVATYYVRSTVLGGQVVAEFNGSGAWTRGYVYLGGQMLAVQQQGAVSWMHEDPVAKSKRVTNSAGTVVSTVELDPWGGETNRSSNEAFQPKKFTSYERDANGGDDAMMRRYTAKWHRFSQPDPYDGSYDATDPQSFNRYSYTQNDPVNFTDPSGLLIWSGFIGGGGDDVIRTYTWARGDFPWDFFYRSFFGATNRGPLTREPSEQGGGRGDKNQKTERTTDACEAMANLAQILATTAMDFWGNAKNALIGFDTGFSQKYIGHPIASLDEGRDLYMHGIGKSTIDNYYRGATGFKDQFKDSRLGPIYGSNNSDQTHHFAAYLSAGINGVGLGAFAHQLGDLIQLNRGDMRLGNAAYQIGKQLRNDPSSLSKIGDIIRKEICN